MSLLPGWRRRVLVAGAALSAACGGGESGDAAITSGRAAAEPAAAAAENVVKRARIVCVLCVFGVTAEVLIARRALSDRDAGCAKRLGPGPHAGLESER